MCIRDSPVDPRGGPEGRSAAGGAALANLAAHRNRDTKEQALVKDLDELRAWKTKLTGYQHDNQRGAVTTGVQLGQGVHVGTNRDRWRSVEGRIGRAGVAGGEEALAFVLRVLAARDDGVAD